MRTMGFLPWLLTLALLAPGATALAGEGRQLTADQVEELQRKMEQRRKEYFQKRYGKDWKQAYEKDRQKRQVQSAQGASKLFQEAEKAFKEEKYGIAYNYYVDVAAYGDSKGAAALAAKSRDRIYEIRHMAEDKLEEARLKIRLKDGPSATGILTDVIEKFGFSDAAAEAYGLLRSLEKDPRVAAAALLAQAEAAEATQLWADAVEHYRALVERYPESVEAFKGKRHLEEILREEVVQEALKAAAQARADEKAPPLLRFARNFALNKRTEAAIKRYRQVADSFAGTRYAEHALACIKALETKEPLPPPLEPPAPAAPEEDAADAGAGAAVTP